MLPGVHVSWVKVGDKDWYAWAQGGEAHTPAMQQ